MWRDNHWMYLVVTMLIVIVWILPVPSDGQSSRERPGGRLSRRTNQQPAQDVVQGTTIHTLNLSGSPRTYRLHIPATLTQQTSYPLVLSFHGLHSNAAQQETLSAFSSLADQEGFIVVYPDGLDAKWHFVDRNGVDVEFVDEILADVNRHVAIDARRMYATGISNGAQMVWRLVCDRPTLFAAVGFVAGGYPGVCSGPRPPAILFHGTDDRLLPYDGRGKVLMPVRDFVRVWVSYDDHPSPDPGAIIFQQGDAIGEQWTEGNRVVILYTLSGKGHSWPGSTMPDSITSQDIDATTTMWTFFTRWELSESSK